MEIIILMLSLIYILYLVYEDRENKKNRDSFVHVIHINGTRGKSSTSRLIEAALRGGEYRIFCKTTGSSPRTIDVAGKERIIHRRGRPNIKEQIGILKEAARQKADIVIIECMAVRPELQYIAQNRILNADISVVTNVRRDHLEEMGPTLKDVAIALGNVMPRNGHFITADKRFIEYYSELGQRFNTEVHLAEDLEEDYGIDFKENVSIALEICKILGVDRDIAIKRMRKYNRDPGVLKAYRLELKENREILFVNGFAINDPDSILMIYEYLQKKGLFKEKKLILLVNNRGDRGYRVKQHMEVISKIAPDMLWITGGYKRFMRRYMLRLGIPEDDILIVDDYRLHEINGVEENSIIFAIGNLVGHGEKIIEYIEGIGEEYV